MSRVLFSGRFDRPHCGHVATIVKLSKEFDQVVVVVLRYDGEHYPSHYRKDVLDWCVPDNVLLMINDTHFAEITREEWETFGCDVYAGGNEEVNEHMRLIGVPVYHVDRSFGYAASDEYKGQAGKQ
ncbi:MAG: adenylyltransferase/cytidyltransferase family protein [Armatimonadia bacterium]|nr:adenylyltransferase/cytidyltransferase family protein [Armatimonadia bacterium]